MRATRAPAQASKRSMAAPGTYCGPCHARASSSTRASRPPGPRASRPRRRRRAPARPPPAGAAAPPSARPGRATRTPAAASARRPSPAPHHRGEPRSSTGTGDARAPATPAAGCQVAPTSRLTHTSRVGGLDQHLGRCPVDTTPPAGEGPGGQPVSVQWAATAGRGGGDEGSPTSGAARGDAGGDRARELARSGGSPLGDGGRSGGWSAWPARRRRDHQGDDDAVPPRARCPPGNQGIASAGPYHTRGGRCGKPTRAPRASAQALAKP